MEKESEYFDLGSSISKRLGINYAETKGFITLMFEIIKKELIIRKRIYIKDFGALHLVPMKTPEDTYFPVVRFKPAKNFKKLYKGMKMYPKGGDDNESDRI